MLGVILNNAFEELALLSIEESSQEETIFSFLKKKRKNKVLITADWIDPKIKSGIKIEINDNGRGFSDIDKAYQPFSTTKADFGGTGLGLNIAKRICAFLKIEVSIDSNKSGTKFTLRIPDMENKCELHCKSTST